ncbi:hypothetical protein PN836_003570 [Ningiella sp. W23]|uniref:hypothetical protein n=1 Tax=Ningiella sp. W23 TaxID=3023715 RepID=UPI0037571309
MLAIADDKALLKQIATFPYDYIDAHSIVDKEHIGGILAFEILLAVLTAGAGAAVSAASKSKYLLKANTALNKIAKLLKRKKLSKKTSPALKQVLQMILRNWKRLSISNLKLNKMGLIRCL